MPLSDLRKMAVGLGCDRAAVKKVALSPPNVEDAKKQILKLIKALTPEDVDAL